MNNEGIKVVHAIPGRVRLKVPKMRQNPAFEAEIRDRLSTAKAIQRIEINPVTGSVLLLYNPEEITLPGSLFSLWKSFSSLFPEINFEELKSCLISSISPSTRQFTSTQHSPVPHPVHPVPQPIQPIHHGQQNLGTLQDGQ